MSIYFFALFAQFTEWHILFQLTRATFNSQNRTFRAYRCFAAVLLIEWRSLRPCSLENPRASTGFFQTAWTSELENKKSTDPRAHMSPKPVLDAPPGVRTLDTLIKSQVLYQLS